MKVNVIGTFLSRKDAEEAVDLLHKEAKIPHEEISYVYKNEEGDIKDVDTEDVSSKTPGEGAKKGAKIGAVAGALGGLAAAAGIIPVIGPILAAGPLLSALGIGGGLAGGAVAGAAGGAAVGGLIGALVNLGVDKEKAKEYEDRVLAGNILVAVHTEDEEAAVKAMRDAGADTVETYTV